MLVYIKNMVSYDCKKCKYSTNIKSHLNRHLKTKKHRLNEVSSMNIPKELMGMNQNEPQMNHNEPAMNHNEPVNIQKEPVNIQKDIKKYPCDYCEETFNTLPSKRRHELHRCKENINVSNTIITKQEIQIKKLEKEKENQIKKLEKAMEKQKKDLMKQIEILLTKVGNTTINNTQTNNIQLNNYGSEDLSHISYSDKTQMLKIPYVMIQRMIEKVHFNDLKPENQNLMIVNKKDKYIKIYENGKWIYKDKKTTMEDLIDGKYFILDEHFNEITSDELSEIQKDRYEGFQTKYDNKENGLHKELLEKTELTLLNQMV